MHGPNPQQGGHSSSRHILQDIENFKASTHSHIVRNQIVDRLRSKNMDIEYVVFEDEGHGFTKYSNLVKAQEICRIPGREITLDCTI